MKNKGFTLAELLGIIVVLSVVAVIATPIVQKTLLNSKDQVYESVMKSITDAAKDWASKNTFELPSAENETQTVLLETLKKDGYIGLNIKNPKTKKILSDQTSVEIKRVNSNYVYTVTPYDLVSADKVEVGAPNINMQGNLSVNVGIGGKYEEAGYNAGPNQSISIQIIYKNKEVSKIDTSKAGTYTVYYSSASNNKLGIVTRTVIVGTE